MQTLADRIKQRMDALDITQDELAAISGLSQSAIHKLVSGKSLSSRRMPQLAKALGCNVYWLMDGTGQPDQITAKPSEQKIAKVLGISADWLDTCKGSPEQKQDNQIHSYKISVFTGKSTVVVLSRDAEDVIKKINRYIENGWDLLSIDRIQPSCMDADQPGTTTKYAY